MRAALSEALLQASLGPDFVFLTGDLGYNALEPLRDALGPRFINAGVAEQNMISVSAGLASQGFRPWVYSIAPFLYGRPFEQIRNDLCMHGLPVVLIGNGGGYAYGVMGRTHHALEDYGVLLGLSPMRVFVPPFAADLPAAIARLSRLPHPGYLRLGRCERPKDWTVPVYAPWRRLAAGGGPTLVAVGPLVGGLLAVLSGLPEKARPELWALAELPVDAAALPAAFRASLKRSGHLIVVEEHVAHGGAGQQLALALLQRGEAPARFTHRCALGYPSGLYGSQSFHRKESGLDPASVLAAAA
ncbi:MAG: transketolase [Elusimicrobia bacterium]|nr:transketolase [Elusimicrobiota bacterium]